MHATPRPSPLAFGSDPATLARLFGDDQDLLPLWVAEPDLPLAPAIVAALEHRASLGWYGYERRPRRLRETLWQWMTDRHGWEPDGLHTIVSPSVGTSIGVLLESVTAPGDGVVLQPPAFTDFKSLVQSADRTVVRNPLACDEDGRWTMDLDHLATVVATPDTTALLLCNPHNPTGRAWSPQELSDLAGLCARHDVFVIADEIHLDLALPGHRITAFGTVAGTSGVRWASLVGPIKTFGLAGVCDTLTITPDDDVAGTCRARSSQLHLSRNNVFALAAWEAAYTQAGPWLDEQLSTVASHVELLVDRLPDPIRLVAPEATYLAWLDLRGLGLSVPDLARWLVEEAALALSPGHWFGREGAGFARMTVAVPSHRVHAAVDRLTQAVARM